MKKFFVHQLGGILLSVLISCTFAGGALAQDTFTVELGRSIVVPAARSVDSVFVADETIADVSVSPSDSVILYGRSVGETSLTLASADGRTTTVGVIVTHNLSELRRTLSTRFPSESIQLRSARGSLMVGGVVSSEEVRRAVSATLEGVAGTGEVLNRLVVGRNNLVRLEVQVLEVNQSQARDFGVDWDIAVANSGLLFSGNDILGFGYNEDVISGSSFSATLNLLLDNNIATILQKTTLAAVDGQQATFEAGTEFALPQFSAESDTFQNANFSVEYNFVGTSLTFTPTFLPGHMLLLDIETEVSETLQSTTAINGNVFPDTSYRRFDTNVQLQHGEPFAITGLSRNTTSSNLTDSTGSIGSRVVNTIFGQDRVTGVQQELVIIVTPYLASAKEETIQDRILRRPSNLNYLLSQRLGSSVPNRSTPAGFQY